MRTYFFKTPWWLRWYWRGALCAVDTSEKILFLTFDDGPVSDVTPFVLDTLDQYDARATFFCLGQNMEAHPHLVQQITARGHLIGNHTYHHLDGWKVDDDQYLRDIQLMDDLIPATIFRPPYGRIKRSQRHRIKKQVVLWSHMAGDFDRSLNVSKALRALLDAGRGSIMVFHDSNKAFDNLKVLLPTVLKHYSQSGYIFKTLEGYAID